MAKGAWIGEGNFKQRNLPSGYTQVEYIESSGTQYIDTGFKPNQDTRVIMDAVLTEINTTVAANAFFGARTTATSKAYGVQWHVSRSAVQHFYNEGYNFSATLESVPTRQNIDSNKNVLSYNGVIDEFTYESFQCDYYLYLFAMNEAGVASFLGNVRVYSCQVYDNGTLVRDFVPCKNASGTVGLYDVVNGIFYSNVGTGTFTAGANYSSVARKIKKGYVGVENFTKRVLPSGYTQVEYIQSSGTQYIDTGFTPNQNTRLILKYGGCTTSAWSEVFGAGQSVTNPASNFLIVENLSNGVQAQYGSEYYTATVTTDGSVIDMNKNCLYINDSLVHTFTNTAFISPYTLRLFDSATNKEDYGLYSGKIYSCQIYDNGTLVRDYVPCINTSNDAGLYDLVNEVFYSNAGTGTFTAGANYSSVARKIKKAYLGVGGLARPFWSSGELEYYGRVTDLSRDLYNHAATTVGDYAIFGGGNLTNVVHAYNSSLVQSTPTPLSVARFLHAATTIGNYALFGGGQKSGGYSSNVDAYDTSLTRSIPTGLGAARYQLAATTVGDYAIFGGGNDASNVSSKTSVDSYNSSLTRTGISAFDAAPGDKPTATTVGNYAIFSGSARVYTYTTSLTKNTITISIGIHLAATTVGDYALFGGGYVSDYSAAVNAFDSSLTRTTITSLSVKRDLLAATTVGDYALFGGGRISQTEYSKVVDVFDGSLTRTTTTDLYSARSNLKATTVGDYALFGGGYGGNGTCVDVYVVV